MMELIGASYAGVILMLSPEGGFCSALWEIEDIDHHTITRKDGIYYHRSPWTVYFGEVLLEDVFGVFSLGLKYI
jgi:hypothetical protein